MGEPPKERGTDTFEVLDKGDMEVPKSPDDRQEPVTTGSIAEDVVRILKQSDSDRILDAIAGVRGRAGEDEGV